MCIRMKRLCFLIESVLGDFSGEVFLYGAGKRGEVALSNLRKMGYARYISGFVDDRARKDMKMGCRVSTIDDLTEQKRQESLFFISTYAVKGMVNRLVKSGVPIHHIFYFPELLITDYCESDFMKSTEQIRRTEDLLSDALSKFIYKSAFEIYRNGNIAVLSRTMGKCQYFPILGSSDYVPGFELGTDECFVDCGAFDGDTIKVFQKLTHNQFRKIYAFEANFENYSRLVENYGDDERVIAINSAVYSETTTLSFSDDEGTSSCISETGNKQVNAVSLDEVLKNKERVSLIKMDIEGSELAALKGAAGIIKRDHPKLAVCIYHKLEDLWEVPLYIHSIDDRYHLYVRNYEDRLDEMVCYAV